MTHNRDDDMDREDDFYASGNEGDQEAPGIGHNGGPTLEEFEAKLDGMSFEDMMRESRQMLLKKLFAAVAGGYASPQEQNTLRQLLKDNGMIMGDPMEGARDGAPGNAESRKADLPEFQDPEYA